MGQFDKNGYTSIFHNGNFYLVPRATFEPYQDHLSKAAVLGGSLKNGLYMISLKLSERPQDKASQRDNQRNQSENSADLSPASAGKNIVGFVSRASRTAQEWHDALNHCNPQRLSNASRMVDGITLTTTVSKCVCSACMVGKIKDLPFAEKSLRVLVRPGQVISTDTWGPATHPDWNGNRYFVSFVCHFTGKSWTYLYSTKSHLKIITINFLNLIFNQTGRHCTYFRYDKEGGYDSTMVRDFCLTHGITLEPSITGAHQQLGKNENFNHHALQGVRTLLARSGLSAKYWGEALMCWNHVRNKLPASGYPCVPDEAYHDIRQSVAHCIPFGMKVAAYISREHQQSKLFPRGSMGIFLGYAQESKGYRILDPQSESVFEVRSIQLASRSDWPEPIFNRFGEQELPDTGITSELDSYQAESTSTSSSPPVSVTPNASAPVPMVSNSTCHSSTVFCHSGFSDRNSNTVISTCQTS